MANVNNFWAIDSPWLWPLAPIIWLWRFCALMLLTRHLKCRGSSPVPVQSDQSDLPVEPISTQAVEAVSMPPPQPPPIWTEPVPKPPPAPLQPRAPVPTVPPRQLKNLPETPPPPPEPKPPPIDYASEIKALRVLVRQGELQSAYRAVNRLGEADSYTQAQAWSIIARQGTAINPKLTKWATTGLGSVLRQAAESDQFEKIYDLSMGIARFYVAREFFCPGLVAALKATYRLLPPERQAKYELPLSTVVAAHVVPVSANESQS